MTKKMYDIVPGDLDNCPAPPERCFAIIDEETAKRHIAEADGVEDC